MHGGISYSSERGNKNYYGYTVPRISARDGDLYFCLKAGNLKQGLYLYKEDNWILIDGQPPSGVLYDTGIEVIAWVVTAGCTKNDDDISLKVGEGTFTSEAHITETVDITNYNSLLIKYMYQDNIYEYSVDISAETGNQYIGFYYKTEANGNECGIFLSSDMVDINYIQLQSSVNICESCKLFLLALNE